MTKKKISLKNKITKQDEDKIKSVQDKVFKYISNIFKNNKISGIIYIPSIGALTFYNDDLSKLKVLDTAKIELESERISRYNKAVSIVTQNSKYAQDSQINKEPIKYTS